MAVDRSTTVRGLVDAAVIRRTAPVTIGHEQDDFLKDAREDALLEQYEINVGEFLHEETPDSGRVVDGQ